MLLNIPFLSIFLQVATDIDYITNLYKLSPVIGLLLIAIGYLAYLLKKKDDKIAEKEAELKEVNSYVRESELENIKILEKVSGTLDRVLDAQKSGDQYVVKEIENLKHILLIKLKLD